MERQEKLFKLLKEEQIEHRYEPRLPLTSIVEPDDAVEPLRELVEDVGERGVIEPLILQQTGPHKFRIISGRRRYLAAQINEIETVPALITRVSVSQRDVLCIKLNRLRAENLLADIEATERLVAKGLGDKQIGDLTGLKSQEIERRKRLAVANSGIRDLLREGRCSLSVAEAAAKLPPGQQTKLIKRLAEEGAERLTMRDVQEIKEARSQTAIDALPQDLFTKSFDLPSSSNGHHAEDEPNEWLHRFAGQLWETLPRNSLISAQWLPCSIKGKPLIENAKLLASENVVRGDAGFPIHSASALPPRSGSQRSPVACAHRIRWPTIALAPDVANSHP
jgi:ParB-like chromosome segregation protein Spo0J